MALLNLNFIRRTAAGVMVVWLLVTVGWLNRCARFGLKNDSARAVATGAFGKFHVAYHGTKVETVLGTMRCVLTCGLCLPRHMMVSMLASMLRCGRAQVF